MFSDNNASSTICADRVPPSETVHHRLLFDGVVEGSTKHWLQQEAEARSLFFSEGCKHRAKFAVYLEFVDV